MLPVPLVAFCVALVVSLLQRTLGTNYARPSPSPLPSGRSSDAEGGTVKVCFAARVNDDWQSVVVRYLQSASRPEGVEFGILLQCDAVADVFKEHEDSLYRRVVTIHHCTRLDDEKHERRVRRMARTFLTGQETAVIFADPRLVVRWGWDGVALRTAASLTNDDVVSVPCSAQHDVAFPVLRVNSAGMLVRDAAKPFSHATTLDDATTHVPSVCWCTEFTLGRPLAFDAWPNKRVSWWEQMDAKHHWVLTAPVLERATESLEEHVLDVNYAPSETLERNASVASLAVLGLSARPSELECMHKYGSSRAARMAVKLERQRSRGDSEKNPHTPS